ncbi:MAG: type II secretion system protein [Acidimicrobiales bacterium]
MRSIRRGRSGRSEAGDTLVEVLLALIVLSLASVAVIVAFSTTISASGEHRSLATFNTMIRSATEQAISQVQGTSAVPFNNCAPLSYYQAGIGKVTFAPPPSGTNYTAAITNVSYWTGSGFASGTAAMNTCNTQFPNSPQEITLTVTDPANNTSYSNSFVVDDSVAVTPIAVCPSSDAATGLVFNIEPAGAAAGAAFTVQPQVWVENLAGNCVVTSDLSPATLSITPGTGMSGAVFNNCPGQETSGVVNYTGCAINLGGNNPYELTVTDGSLTATSSSFYVIGQLANPVVTAATPSVFTPNALTITFTAPSNAPGGQLYSVEACTNFAMSAGCVSQSSITSGSDITSLAGGTAYYVQVTALADSGFLASTSAVFGPSSVTGGQLNAPSNVTVGYGAAAGSFTVSFTAPSNAQSGQTYTATYCTTSNGTGCPTASITSGGTIGSLAFTVGNVGTTYYVKVVANADNGFTASNSSAQAVGNETSQVKAPTAVSLSSGSGGTGRIKVTYTASGGTGVASYSLLYGKTLPLSSFGTTYPGNYVSDTVITGLTHAVTYYAVLTAVPQTGYVSNAAAQVQGTSS